MGDVTKIKVEPCIVQFDGADLGFTEGDLSVGVEEKGVDIMAHQEGTNVLDHIRSGKNATLAVTLKETSVAQVQAVLGHGGANTPSVAEVATLTAIADVSGSLNGKTMPLIARDGTKFLLQISVDGGAEPPVVPGWTVVPVAVVSDDANTVVATALAAAINPLAQFAAVAVGAVVTITQSVAGLVAAGSGAGNTGFAYLVTVVGSSLLTGWGKTKDFTGMFGDSKKLVLHPVVKPLDELEMDLAFWKAYPVLKSIKQSGANPKMVEVDFKIFPDPGKPDEVRLFAYGDHS